jgi:hypothetical protein
MPWFSRRRSERNSEEASMDVIECQRRIGFLPTA